MVGKDSEAPVPGGRIVGGYVLLRRLGEGGQAAVWEASDPSRTGSRLAVKVVSIAGAKPAQLERIRREARVLSQCSHPSLPRCYRLFEDTDALLGFAMDLIVGSRLRDAIQDARWSDELACVALHHVAGALAYVHEQGISHRDVNDTNVILSAEFWDDPNDPRHVKLVDFGIAASKVHGPPLTETGMLVGTACSIAPEMLDQQSFPTDDERTADVFAFGVLACLADGMGHPTGLGKNEKDVTAYLDAYREALLGTRRWLRELPRVVPEQVARGALALLPEDRFQHAGELLRTWELPAAHTRRFPRFARRLRRFARRRIWMLALGLFGAALVGGTIAMRPCPVIVDVADIGDESFALVKSKHALFSDCHTEGPGGAWKFCLSDLWLVRRRADRLDRFLVANDLYLPDWYAAPTEWWQAPTGAIRVVDDRIQIFMVSKDMDRTFNVTGRLFEYSRSMLANEGHAPSHGELQPQALVRTGPLFEDENCGLLARFEGDSLVHFSSDGHQEVRTPLELPAEPVGSCERHAVGKVVPQEAWEARKDWLRENSGGAYAGRPSPVVEGRFGVRWW